MSSINTNNNNINELLDILKVLRIQEQTVISEIEEYILYNPTSTVGTFIIQTTTHHIPFEHRICRKGDRVKIINKVKFSQVGSARRTVTEADKLAVVVTAIDGDQIYILTDNGTDIWRLSKDLGFYTE